MKKIFSIILGSIIFFSCTKEQSGTTGWNYNDKDNGDFQKLPYLEQETGPNLVLIEGGTFVMGQVVDDVHGDWNNSSRRITVSSFYMDETEVTNFAWLEYLYWIKRIYYDYPEVYKNALPDTLVWRSKLAYNEPYVNYYLRHPSYRDYPVVGVSWLQAKAYSDWRTDRVNEQILIREGLLEHNMMQEASENFGTEEYLLGQYLVSPGSNGGRKEGMPWRGYVEGAEQTSRRVQMEDGMLLPEYRLPTEAEWEYAAYALIGNSLGESILDTRQWPWNGHSVRNPEQEYMGDMLANFRRGRGDYMGVAGALNDNADVTAPVRSFWPNDYGLYHMGGNVSEWVADVYRPVSFQDEDEFRSFRGNVYEKLKLDPSLDDELAQRDSLGRTQYVQITPDDAANRRNYRKADNINYLDGDYESQLSSQDWKKQSDSATNAVDPESMGMYSYGKTSLINDQARVFKGGSWKDPAYYLSPSTRRFLDEKLSTEFIGFRCAMIRVGSPVGLGNQ